MQYAPRSEVVVFECIDSCSVVRSLGMVLSFIKLLHLDVASGRLKIIGLGQFPHNLLLERCLDSEGNGYHHTVADVGSVRLHLHLQTVSNPASHVWLFCQGLSASELG